MLELLEGGELFDRIVQKTSYNEKEARDLFFVMASAMKYCHDRDIAHRSILFLFLFLYILFILLFNRDLKPENLLMASLSDDSHIKLADFGFAKKTKGNSLTSVCGSPAYIAPEILSGKPYGELLKHYLKYLQQYISQSQYL